MSKKFGQFLPLSKLRRLQAKASERAQSAIVDNALVLVQIQMRLDMIEKMSMLHRSKRKKIKELIDRYYQQKVLLDTIDEAIQDHLEELINEGVGK
jgi:phosphopantothenate synthetase